MFPGLQSGMSSGQIIWFAATAALFVPWAVLAFATMFGLARVAAARRAAGPGGLMAALAITFRTHLDFLAGRLYPRQRLWLVLIAALLFALIAARGLF